jgi:hypothetical protein
MTVELPAGVSMEKLLRLYEKQRKCLEKRAEFYKTEEGKAYNRQKAKEYYERNKAMVQEKNRERYRAKKLTGADAPTAT